MACGWWYPFYCVTVIVPLSLVNWVWPKVYQIDTIGNFQRAVTVLGFWIISVKKNRLTYSMRFVILFLMGIANRRGWILYLNQWPKCLLFSSLDIWTQVSVLSLEFSFRTSISTLSELNQLMDKIPRRRVKQEMWYLFDCPHWLS